MLRSSEICSGNYEIISILVSSSSDKNSLFKISLAILNIFFYCSCFTRAPLRIILKLSKRLSYSKIPAK
jgi:hypothetical protein